MSDNQIVGLTFLVGMFLIGALGFFILMILSEWLDKKEE